MNLNQTQKVILGLFTFLPFVLLPYMIFEIFNFVVETVRANEYGEPDFDVVMSGIFAFVWPIIVIGLTSVMLFIYYIIHVAKNPSLDTTERIIWIFVFIFFGIIGFPVYFFMRVWSTPVSQ